MAQNKKKEEVRTFAEEADSLWLITLACSTWAIHFVICYGAAAFVCAKWSSDPGMITNMRVGLGIITVLALGGVSYIGWRSWVQWDFLDDYDYEHDLAEEEHRHEFLGHASFLLSIISFIGVIYVSLPILFLETCQ